MPYRQPYRFLYIVNRAPSPAATHTITTKLDKPKISIPHLPAPHVVKVASRKFYVVHSHRFQLKSSSASQTAPHTKKPR